MSMAPITGALILGSLKIMTKHDLYAVRFKANNSRWMSNVGLLYS